VRRLGGVLVLLPLVALIGQGQAPSVPTGEGHISGRILTSMSQPIAGATVLLGLNDTGVPSESSAWWVATSDPQGLYQFADLPGGRFILIAAKEEYVGWDSIPTGAPAPMAAARPFPRLALAPAVPRMTIDLVPRGRAREVNLTLHKPASIFGRAARPDGSPAVNERVMLYTADDMGVITTGRSGPPLDAKGTYSFTDLRPGTYYLGFSQPGRFQDIDRSTLTPVTLMEGMSLTNPDVLTISDRTFSITGRIVDAFGEVPRALQVDYGVAGSTYRGLISSVNPAGRFEIRDRGMLPGPVTIMSRGQNDEGPVVSVVTLAAIDGPNDVEIVVGKPGALRGRVVMDGGTALTALGARLALVREGFTPLGAADDVIEVAPDGWLEAANLIGEYRVRVDEPQRWTVTAVRRRGIRVPNDRLVIRNAEILDDVEIVIGPR
jgi:hypothetical protein